MILATKCYVFKGVKGDDYITFMWDTVAVCGCRKDNQKTSFKR